jgi:hypothetical protein
MPTYRFVALVEDGPGVEQRLHRAEDILDSATVVCTSTPLQMGLGRCWSSTPIYRHIALPGSACRSQGGLSGQGWSRPNYCLFRFRLPLTLSASLNVAVSNMFVKRRNIELDSRSAAIDTTSMLSWFSSGLTSTQS